MTENETPARAQIMQLTQGWVLLVDGKTLAFQTLNGLTRGIGKELKKRPRENATSTTRIPAPTAESPATPEQIQVQLFNFGRITADADNLSLQDFERAMVEYFPDVAALDWARPIVADLASRLAARPTTVAAASPPAIDPRDKVRAAARKKAETQLLGATTNTPSTPWVHDECGRTSDCFENTEHGLELVGGEESDEGMVPCKRCQECMDNTCPIRSSEEAIAEDLNHETPMDIEPDEDSAWTTTAIVLNEKGDRVGTVEV